MLPNTEEKDGISRRMDSHLANIIKSIHFIYIKQLVYSDFKKKFINYCSCLFVSFLIFLEEQIVFIKLQF